MTDDECKHELPRWMCADCKAGPRYAAPAGPPPARTNSAPFDAQFPGRCAAGDEIEPGDYVRYYEGDLIHVDCEE